LTHHVDPLIVRLLRFGIELKLRDPIRWALAEHRREAMRRTAAAFAPRVEPLIDAVIAREPSAIARYDALLHDAMTEMRSRRPSEGGMIALVSAVEQRLYKNGDELMDDPSFPEEERSSAVDGLHRLNEQFGSYEAFMAILDPLLDVAAARGSGPTRIHDLAAGHGGFATLLKQRLGARAIVEASDLKDEYLALGRARAERLGVDIGFFAEDALALEGPRARGVDIITCTQSIHHFSAGMAARMLGEAVRAARVGACFIDGERSFLICGLVTVAAALYGRSYVLVHDGVVSLRRMFYEEELALIAALAPGLPPSAWIETGATLPAHAFVRVSKVPETQA
jgi:SAM-dependent methyltransferase